MKQFFLRVITAYLFIVFYCCVAFSQSASVQPIAEVPFAFDRTSVIIQVKLNGKGSYNFVLDTGSDVSTIDLATAKELRN